MEKNNQQIPPRIWKTFLVMNVPTEGWKDRSLDVKLFTLIVNRFGRKWSTNIIKKYLGLNPNQHRIHNTTIYVTQVTYILSPSWLSSFCTTCPTVFSFSKEVTHNGGFWKFLFRNAKLKFKSKYVLFIVKNQRNSQWTSNFFNVEI